MRTQLFRVTGGLLLRLTLLKVSHRGMFARYFAEVYSILHTKSVGERKGIDCQGCLVVSYGMTGSAETTALR